MAIGETISHELWSGPGATSFYSAATALQGVVSQISSILGGQQANAGAVLTAWASPTGELAVSANTPYQAWLSEAATQIEAAATQITAAGAAFDFAKAMTPTPGQFAANNSQFAWLTAHNILGLLTPFIIANRVEYAVYTMQAVTAMSFYTTESAGTVGALQSLPAPPITAIPGALTPSISAGLAGQAPSGSALPSAASALPSVASALPSVGSAAAQPVSALSQLAQPGDALMSSGGQLAQAPSAMTSSLGALPSMASTPMSSALGSPTAASGGAGADSGSLLGGVPAAGGTVAAALSGGGAGLSGLGGTSALTAMRGPLSWSSANAASPTAEGDDVVVSRIAEARAASATPATSAGMGAPGAMMPSARQESARGRGSNDTLAAAAVLYRPPRDMPVVTGAAGTQFAAGEEEQ